VAPNRPPRNVTQRIAVVSREGTGTENGVWVELKTTEGGRTRTERGFFMKPEGGKDNVMEMLMAGEGETPAPEAKDAPPSTARLRLARYQRLTTEGKLFEYPVDEDGSGPPEEDVSAMDMFEFQGRAVTDTLPPDTLKVGRRVIPCRVRWTRRAGTQEWPGQDSTYVNRAAMTTTFWRNPFVPVTGTARKIIEVTSVRVSAAGQDSLPPRNPEPTPNAAGKDLFYKATVTLTDLGKDAVPEITQAPEPAPHDAQPRPRAIIK